MIQYWPIKLSSCKYCVRSLKKLNKITGVLIFETVFFSENDTGVCAVKTLLSAEKSLSIKCQLRDWFKKYLTCCWYRLPRVPTMALTFVSF